MSASRHLILGLFFVLVFGILGWFTVFKSEFSLFRESYGLVVNFDGAGGLKTGDTVRVAGMRWGKVGPMTFDPTAGENRRVTVELILDEPIVLYRDKVIEIQDASVLGGKVLTIEPGTASLGPIPADEPLYGGVALNVMDSLADVIRENRDSLASTLRNLEQTVADLRDAGGPVSKLIYSQELAGDLEKAVASIAATFENAQALTDQLRSEERGTIGRLIYEDDLYTDIQKVAEDVQALVADGREFMDKAENGEGTLGLLMSDPELAGRIRSVAERVDNLVTGLDNGDGTLGQLFKDPEIANRVRNILAALDEGEGTLGKLLREEAVYDNVLATTESLASATAALNTGEGTLGRLLNDDELYEELERAVKVLVGSLEEAREAAPISTFLNTVFLGF